MENWFLAISGFKLLFYCLGDWSSERLIPQENMIILRLKELLENVDLVHIYLNIMTSYVQLGDFLSALDVGASSTWPLLDLTQAKHPEPLPGI